MAALLDARYQSIKPPTRPGGLQSDVEYENVDYAAEIKYTINLPNFQLGLRYFEAFLLDLAWVLPCADCRNHFKVYLNLSTPFKSLNFNEGYFVPWGRAGEWTIILHNEVNKQLGKPLHRTGWQTKFEFKKNVFELLFFVTYNYDDSKELDKESHFTDFVTNLLNLLQWLGEKDMVDNLKALDGVTLNTKFMLPAVYAAYMRTITDSRRTFKDVTARLLKAYVK